MDYNLYLTSERWLRLRSEALKRDGNRCKLCNRMNSLEVHHRCYDSLEKINEIDDLITLCHRCHEWFTKQIQKGSTLYLPNKSIVSQKNRRKPKKSKKKLLNIKIDKQKKYLRERIIYANSVELRNGLIKKYEMNFGKWSDKLYVDSSNN